MDAQIKITDLCESNTVAIVVVNEFLFVDSRQTKRVTCFHLEVRYSLCHGLNSNKISS
jgi:hypothetical protein